MIGRSTTFSKAVDVGFNLDDKLVAIIDNNTICFKSFLN
jgi:hypothetical protein